jgi:hypothetical protein
MGLMTEATVLHGKKGWHCDLPNVTDMIVAALKASYDNGE